MLFLNFTTDRTSFESKYQDAANFYNVKGISFLMGDAKSRDNAFQYFGLSPDEAPLIVIQQSNGYKYLKPHEQADQTVPWLNDYKGLHINANSVRFQSNIFGVSVSVDLYV